MDNEKRLTEADRSALLKYLDALIYTWSLSPADSKVEETLSDAIDEVVDRLLMARVDKSRRLDAACSSSESQEIASAIRSAFADDEEDEGDDG